MESPGMDAGMQKYKDDSTQDVSTVKVMLKKVDEMIQAGLRKGEYKHAHCSFTARHQLSSKAVCCDL